MSEAHSPTEDRPEDMICSSVLVGHAIAALDNEAAVSLSVNQQHVRLSPAGARIVATQLTAWADHAEERNKARPGDTMIKLMYRVGEKAGEQKQWQAVPETETLPEDPPPQTAAQAPVEPKRRVKRPRILKTIARKKKAKR